jgi:polysaccharide deacetylase 2 family uncharacterized protein YibQ
MVLCLFRHRPAQLIRALPTPDLTAAPNPARTRLFCLSLNFLKPLLIFLTLSALFQSACSKREKEQVQSPDFHNTAQHIYKAVERAGGSEIWIKGQGGRSSLENRGGPVEVLSVSSKYDLIVAAIRREATVEGLKAEAQPKNPKEPFRSIELRFTGKNNFVTRWHVREVPKLLRAAIVIDDLGQDLEAANKLLREPYPLTFSILPELAFSSQTAHAAHAAHRAVMLHLPMQPEPGSGANPGPGEILIGMPRDEVVKTIRADLNTVPFAEGVNNHMGSRATANAELMAEVMKVLASRGLYFVDSRTTANTRALAMARRQGLPSFYRSVFLDDKETVAYTLDQLRTFRRVVQDRGIALAIGHPHATTLEALKEFLPELERDDIQLIPASQLVHLPEAARLEPTGRGPTITEARNSIQGR